jgi:acyl carrier protein
MEKLSLEPVKNKLKEIIAKNLDANIAISDIDDEVSLYEDGIGLDSISIVNLIVQIESTFKFNFEEDEINSDLFRSVNRLADFISAKQAQAAV